MIYLPSSVNSPTETRCQFVDARARALVYWILSQFLISRNSISASKPALFYTRLACSLCC